MDLDKHGGVPLHAVFFDEIPPQNVFNENLMRLVDYNGFLIDSGRVLRTEVDRKITYELNGS